ncbi:ATP synthase subunit C [Aureimonas endophytica]|uniref:ATP synthase subunit C n=1 Tax=Aureimonas endophytica TaxID=2027858 RepID=A0A916ZZS2_9HYPH|nr:hydantoinase/oxoprolinase family protein [Aureimonas endophytica]GGE20539.1 ATP synthase subunit C [Aureimonas endophytica]
MARVLGWDVGGAHLKAALAEAGEILRVWRVAVPLRRDLRPLDEALARIAAEAGAVSRHAVTMTGELSDVFPDRAAGVAALARALAPHLSGETLFYAGETGFVASPEASEMVASANWHAAARLVAGQIEAALLLDMGSTTTDITVIREGRVDAKGFGDARRLACGELVYQGHSRTALMAVAESVPFEGARVPVIAEPLATMADVRRLLGAEDGDASAKEAGARLARMIGRDAAEVSGPALEALAQAFGEAQLRRVHDAALTVLSRGALDEGAPVVVAGIGRPVLKRLAARLDRGIVDFGDLVDCRSALREEVCAAAPASALAILALSA